MTFKRDVNSWVIEGVLTSLPSNDAAMSDANVAPMGPIVNGEFTRFVLRPFKSATTYRNIKATGCAVFHVTDDAGLIARGAVGRVRPVLDVPAQPAKHVPGVVLTGTSRYYELQVEELDDRDERTTIVARPVSSGRFRDFFGFNRARHAVLEAAILATRLHLSGQSSVLREYEKLQVVVEKTGAGTEREAMEMLKKFVETWKTDPGTDPGMLNDGAKPRAAQD